jgi:hypothetical protein
VGLEPTIPAFERAKRVHAFDHGANAIGRNHPEGRKCRRIQVLSGNLPEGTEENRITSVRVIGAPNEIVTERVTDKSVQSCRYVSKADSKPVKFCKTTRRYIPEVSTIYGHRCENFRSNNDYIVCLILVAPDPTMITLCLILVAPHPTMFTLYV